MMVEMIIALTLGFLLDLCIGDPHWMPHPVKLMGKTIVRGEKAVRKCLPKSPGGEFWGGLLLALFVIGLSLAISLLILWIAGLIHPFFRTAVEGFMCYQILSIKALKEESMKVYRALAQSDLHKARERVSMIVGRDTANLSEEGVAKAAVETVAENTADGVVAPLLFMAIGGAPLGFCYKAVNTLDSMIGYKNEKYKHFGTFAARLDDAANYLPARLAAVMMLAAAWLLHLDYKNALKIFRRDRNNHASPNSAQTEAVCAGALQIQLSGDACYFGTLYPKKTIGDPLRVITCEDIRQANRLLYGTAWIAFISCILTMGIITWMI